VAQTRNDPGDEAFYFFGYSDDAAGKQKSASISAFPVDDTASTGFSELRLNVTKTGGTVDDVFLIGVGGHGSTFFPTSSTDYQTDKTLKVRGKQWLADTDVGHGMTDVADADVFGVLDVWSGTAGGLYIQGLCDTGDVGMTLRGVGVTPSSNRTAAATGTIQVWGAKKNGTGVAAMDADTNLVVFANQGAAKHIFTTNGDSFQDGTGWTAYDKYDDIELANALDKTLDPAIRGIQEENAEWLRKNEQLLERAGLVHFNRDFDGVPFVNNSGILRLHNGSIRQLWARHEDLRESISSQLADLKSAVQRLLPKAV
jgi:hypothetical protein